jgi:hypothetical protein
MMSLPHGKIKATNLVWRLFTTLTGEASNLSSQFEIIQARIKEDESV